MARTHGKILCSIWDDDDFTALPGDAQRLYMLLVSQPKLNLAGLLDYRPGRWAIRAADTTTEDIQAAVDTLEAARFITVDRDTDELLIRSFTKSDPIQFANSKLRKGLWSAWRAIESTALRTTAVDNAPDELFAYPETPAEAVRIRRSLRTEPPTEPPNGSPDPEGANRSPNGFSSASATATTTATASAARPANDDPVEKAKPDPEARPPIPPVDEVLDPSPPDFATGLDALRALRSTTTVPTTDHDDHPHQDRKDGVA